MPARLVQSSYGKSRVRLTKVTRHADRHELIEISVDILLEGDFDASYTAGDNRDVIATDSMKNTVYVLARENPVQSIEPFGALLAGHFLKQYSQVRVARVELSQSHWNRIDAASAAPAHAFTGDCRSTRTCSVRATQPSSATPEIRVESGLRDLPILKTTHSEFAGFVRDRFATLADTRDRILATLLTARWLYRTANHDWDGCYQRAQHALLATFAAHHSLAVQQTLFAMGEAALAACGEIETITLEMPNQHRLPVNLGPLGLDNPNEIFVPTDEPFGLIAATLSRA